MLVFVDVKTGTKRSEREYENENKIIIIIIKVLPLNCNRLIVFERFSIYVCRFDVRNSKAGKVYYSHD